mgnify:CR=1 FL=1
MRWYEKYRPKTLEEVVGQENAKKQIEIALRSGWGGKAYWISGASGTGKTCLLYQSPSPRDRTSSRMPSFA